MTKQEEIRKQVDSIIQQALDKGKTPEQITDLIFVYQHLQGVVIRVDRELPKRQRTWGDAGIRPAIEEATQRAMLDAGYVAVESLIEEGE